MSLVDPFAGVDLAGVERPANPGRFAALLGMVGDEAAGTHAARLPAPQEAPRAAPRRGLLLLAASVLGLAALVAGYVYWDTLSELQQRNAELVQQRKKLDEALKAGRAGRNWPTPSAPGRNPRSSGWMSCGNCPCNCLPAATCSSIG